MSNLIMNNRLCFYFLLLKLVLLITKMKVTWEIGVCILLVILVIYIYHTSYDYRYSLCGVWVATPQFCTQSEITSMVLQLRDKDDNIDEKGLPTKGHLVITHNMDVLSNQGIKISGWSMLKQRQPEFREKITVICSDEEIFPAKLYIRHSNNRLYLEDSETLYAIMYKI